MGALRSVDHWDKFDPSGHADFISKLREFRGDSNLERNTKLTGQEGQLFLSDKHPGFALKRWFSKALNLKPKSVELHKQAAEALERSPSLKKDLDVVRFFEEGRDWVRRDFDRSSVELTKALRDPEAAAARARVIEGLRREGFPGNVLSKIQREPPSANIHWSPTKKKILIIDMQ